MRRYVRVEFVGAADARCGENPRNRSAAPVASRDRVCMAGDRGEGTCAHRKG
jgi:hypothetical protein